MSIDYHGDALAPETQMMGLGYDPALSEGAIKPPLFQTSTFVFSTPEAGKRFFEVAYGLRAREPDESLGLIYSRINNPNVEILEDRLVVWDGAEKALAFSSGMAAIATTILTFCKPGETIAYTMPGYGGTEYLMKRILPRFGIRTIALPIDEDPSLISEKISSVHQECGRTGSRMAMIYLETPANPTNEMVDLSAASAAARHVDPADSPIVVVDNTFLGPLWQQPIRHGADLVLYSLTKYVGGHSDLIAGAVMGRADLISAVGEMRTMLGTNTDPHTAWLLLRSLETLKLRMEQSTVNAVRVARFLSGHPRVSKVLFPLATGVSSRQLALYHRQCSGPGSTLSFRLRDASEKEAFDVLRQLKLFKLAVSLGGTESLASHPSSMTHCDYSADEKRRFGVSDDLIRISVGIENSDDLIGDLRAGLVAVG